jgi:hypothetical protein
MKLIARITLLTALMLTLLTSGCDEYLIEANDYYNFTIIGNGGSFHGSYKLDAESVVNFISEPSGNYYEIFEKNLTSPGVITITADADNNNVTSLRIYVYQGSEVVASSSKYQVDAETIGLELTHTFKPSEK